jgi:hypothetical protein
MRGDSQTGQSPGKDVLRGVSVRVIGMATLDAGEDRLALAVLRCYVAALAALLRRETWINVGDPRPRRGGFLLGTGGEDAPSSSEDASVQSRFLATVVR